MQISVSVLQSQQELYIFVISVQVWNYNIYAYLANKETLLEFFKSVRNIYLLWLKTPTLKGRVEVKGRLINLTAEYNTIHWNPSSIVLHRYQDLFAAYIGSEQMDTRPKRIQACAYAPTRRRLEPL